jgi:hypothetical protein
MLGRKAVLLVTVLASWLYGATFASADARFFKVHFGDCTEFVGWGPISLVGLRGQFTGSSP